MSPVDECPSFFGGTRNEQVGQISTRRTRSLRVDFAPDILTNAVIDPPVTEDHADIAAVLVGEDPRRAIHMLDDEAL